MENWIPLYSACIGGLLATIPLLLGLIVQVGLHISENRQKKREAKTQLALELLRNDVDIVDKNVDVGLSIMDSVSTISLKADIEALSEDDLQKELDTLFLKGNLSHSGEMEWIAGKIAYSLGNEIYSEYARLEKLYHAYWKAVVPSYDYEEERKVYFEVLQSAAKIHTMLKEKLLSIR